MRTERDGFSGSHRVLHWLMAIMVLTMLFIGVSMVSTLRPRYLTLISIHKPIGIAILALAVLRLGVRWRLGAPPLPDDLPRAQDPRLPSIEKRSLAVRIARRCA